MMNPVSPSQFHDSHKPAQSANLVNVGLRQLRGASSRSPQTDADSVLCIFAAGDPLKIDQPRVRLVPIDVVDLSGRRLMTKEARRHETMDLARVLAIHFQVHSRIARPADRCPQRPGGITPSRHPHSAYAAVVTDFVPSLELVGWAPLFVGRDRFGEKIPPANQLHVSSAANNHLPHVSSIPHNWDEQHDAYFERIQRVAIKYGRIRRIA